MIWVVSFDPVPAQGLTLCVGSAGDVRYPRFLSLVPG